MKDEGFRVKSELAKAMLEGKAKYPEVKQNFDAELLKMDSEGKVIEACAVGFALLSKMEGLPSKNLAIGYETARKLFPDLTRLASEFYEDEEDEEEGTKSIVDKIEYHIWHYNDNEKLSVEEIAEKTDDMVARSK